MLQVDLDEIVGKTESCQCAIKIKDAPEEALEAVVVASCVSSDPPFISHPFRLTSDKGTSEEGVVSKSFKRYIKSYSIYAYNVIKFCISVLKSSNSMISF